MNTNRYAAAGWAAILSAAGSLAVLGLSIVFDLANVTVGRGSFRSPPWSTDQVLLVAAVDAVAWALGIYALVRFRDLLRERYDFHALDHLIWIVIGAGVLVPIVSYAVRLSGDGGMGNAFAGVAAMVVLGVLNGVIGIVFAMRLLRLNGNLNGYKKPFAYIYIAGSVCFLLVITSIVGMVLLTASTVLMGLVFFRGSDLEELEVV